METYDTVTEAINGLRLKGFTIDFNIVVDKIICSKNEVYLHPDEFEITATYRFEGETNPSDEDIVYAITSKDGKTKGIISSAYGLYADVLSNEMIQKLATHH